MPDIADLKEDLTEAAKEAGRKISSIFKRQYRIRLTNACRVCNNLNLRDHDETHPIGRLDLGFVDIRSAARSGCPYCALVLTCIEHLLPGAEREFKVMLQYPENGFFELVLGYNEKLQFEIFLPPGKPVSSETENLDYITLQSEIPSCERVCFGILLTPVQKYRYHLGHNYETQERLRAILVIWSASSLSGRRSVTVRITRNVTEHHPSYCLVESWM